MSKQGQGRTEGSKTDGGQRDIETCDAQWLRSRNEGEAKCLMLHFKGKSHNRLEKLGIPRRRTGLWL